MNANYLESKFFITPINYKPFSLNFEINVDHTCYIDLTITNAFFVSNTRNFKENAPRRLN